MTTLMFLPADAPPTELTLTDDELDRLLDETRGEFVHGQVVEKPMGMHSNEIVTQILGLLWGFARDNGLGTVWASDTGFRCFPSDPKQVRKPDVSFVAAGRLPAGVRRMAYCPVAPDLAVEVVSPNDKYEELEEKVADYRSAGVKLVWVVNPSTKTVLVRRLDKTCAELDADGTLDGEGVVPGFACKVAELFA